MRRFVIFIHLLLLSLAGFTQTISGKLSYAKNDSISLFGFDGLKNYSISTTIADSNGNFSLNFSDKDYGMGFLQASDNKPFFVVLTNEPIQLKGESLSFDESITIEKGRENQLFGQYAAEHPRRERALSAWDYLEKIYGQDSLFLSYAAPNKAIREEKQRIKREDADFLNVLPKNSYVSWYLPMRTLISSVSTIARYRPDEIPATINALRQIDYTDNRLYKSGMFKDAIDNHYWLIENSGSPLDSVFVEMKNSIDAMMITLVNDKDKLNEITGYLFTLLEQHSLYKASEYLALKVLEDDECGCSVQQEVADHLEQYRTMKIGNTAPDIDFSKHKEFFAPRYETGTTPEKLSDIKSEYMVVLFGSSWCPECGKEIPKILPLYEKWRQKGIEVVFVSLDVEKKMFDKFTSYLPFISICDYSKWDGTVVRNYYVSATPTMYLLDKNRKIILKPNSVEHLNAWIDYTFNGPSALSEVSETHR